MGRIINSLIILVFIPSISFGQTKNENKFIFKIDSNEKDKIEKKVKSTNGISMGSMDIKLFENDSLMLDSYKKENSLESMTMSSLENDTAYITGFLGMFAGFGFQIALFQDTCIVRYFSNSDVEIYKLNKSDSLNFGVSVPCKSYKLTLVQKPTLRKGEIIEGNIELPSEDYYEVANGKENKYRVELIGYFKSEPL